MKAETPKFNTRHDKIAVPGFGKLPTIFDVEVSIFNDRQTLVIIHDREDNTGPSVTNNIERVVGAVKKAYLVTIPREKLTIVAVDNYEDASVIRNEEVTTGFEYISTEDLNKLKKGEFL